jgi:hypothetical protein
MKRILAIAAVGVLPLAVWAAAAAAPPPTSSSSTSAPDERAPEPVMERGNVRAIKLPEAPVELPDAPGRQTAVTYCATCHTLAYIPLQPPFSRETWTAEVTKMQKTFSAPIPDNKVAEIVDYLVAVRGQPAKK